MFDVSTFDCEPSGTSQYVIVEYRMKGQRFSPQTVNFFLISFLFNLSSNYQKVPTCTVHLPEKDTEACTEWKLFNATSLHYVCELHVCYAFGTLYKASLTNHSDTIVSFLCQLNCSQQFNGGARSGQPLPSPSEKFATPWENLFLSTISMKSPTANSRPDGSTIFLSRKADSLIKAPNVYG